MTSAGNYTFRICPSDLAHGAALAHWVRDRLHLTHGAVLYLNDQYGRGIRQTFVAEFLTWAEISQAVDPYLGDRPDVGAVSRSPRQAGASPSSSSSPATGARRRRSSARRASAASTMPVLGGDGLEGIQEAGALAEGVVPLLALFSVDSDARPTAASSRRSGEVSRGRAAQPARRRRLRRRSTSCAT